MREFVLLMQILLFFFVTVYWYHVNVISYENCIVLFCMWRQIWIICCHNTIHPVGKWQLFRDSKTVNFSCQIHRVYNWQKIFSPCYLSRFRELFVIHKLWEVVWTFQIYDFIVNCLNFLKNSNNNPFQFSFVIQN